MPLPDNALDRLRAAFVSTDAAQGDGAPALRLQATGTQSFSSMVLSGSLGFGSGSGDTFLLRDAANVLAQRNGTTAQAFRLYNTYASAGTDFERLDVVWSSNTMFVQTNQGGTGSARALTLRTVGSAALGLGTAATTRWNVSSSGHLLAEADNTYDIGASGATRPRSFYFATAIIGPGTTASAGQIRFANNQYAMWRNTADSANAAIGLNASDLIEVTAPLHLSSAMGANSGFISFLEQADPAAPAADGARLYAKDNGSGKTQLVVRFPTGAVQVLATEP